MRLEDVTAEIRPRSPWEAIDLGLAMVRRDAGKLAVCWLVTALPVHLLVLWLMRDALWLGVFILWWLRPVFARVGLFFLSRALFGERPSIREVLRAWPAMWWRRIAYRLVWARFSPWRVLTAPVEELEHLRGSAYRQRCAQLLAIGGGAAFGLLAVSLVLTAIGVVSLITLGLMFVPEEVTTQWTADSELWLQTAEISVAPGLQWLLGCVVLLVFAAVDSLATGAGFGLYVNSRTLTEGWDIELALKRMRERLGAVSRPAGLLLVTLLLLAAHPSAGAVEASGAVAAGTGTQAGGGIQEVLADPDFKVHTVEEQVPVADPGSRWLRSSMQGAFGAVFGAASMLVGWFLLVLLVAGVVWLIVRYWPKSDGAPVAQAEPLKRQVRTVMGMDIAADSLPADIPAAAWRAWQIGRHQEAMSMLYRGAIGAFVSQVQLEIEEGDTERDCLRRVGLLGTGPQSRYFAGLTDAWISLAYGRSVPQDGEMQALCRDWPFSVQGGRG
jgi:hypothetical protein